MPEPLKTPSRNPKSASNWASAVKPRFREVNSADILLSHLTNGNSASKLTYKDFLCLKIIYKTARATDFKLDQYVNAAAISKAESLLTSAQCQQFFADAGNFQGAMEHPEDSIFGLVGLYMNLVFELDASTTSSSNKVLVTPRPFRRDETPAMAPDSPLAGKGAPWAKDSDTEMEDSPRVITNDYNEAQTPSDRMSLSSSVAGPLGWSPAQPHEMQVTPTEDEMLVNMAFVLLLNALTERHDAMRSKGYRWLPNRDALKICKSPPLTHRTAGEDKIPKLMEARTDGCLRNTKHKLSAAILEVKPYLRGRDTSLVQIQWQEGAQMAAYIYTLLHSKPPPNPLFGQLLCNIEGFKRRLLFSQDHGEIYVTIATYDDAYEEYLGKHHAQTRPQNDSGDSTAQTQEENKDKGKRGKSRATSGFLTMHTYGPWRIDEAPDMKSLCLTLLALSLHLTEH